MHETRSEVMKAKTMVLQKPLEGQMAHWRVLESSSGYQLEFQMALKSLWGTMMAGRAVVSKQ